MYPNTAKLSFKSFVSALLAVFLLVASVSTRSTSAQSPRPSANGRSDAKARILAARANRRPSPREMIFSEDPLSESQLQERLIDRQEMTRSLEDARDRDPGLAASGSPESLSNHKQFAGAQNALSNVRVPVRDLGPETGVSGSGSGFVFNRDTRKVILPTFRRVFRSLNGGNNWSPSDLTVDFSSELHPNFGRTVGSYFVRRNAQNPQVLYAATADSYRLARSNDFGTTWTQLGEGDALNHVRDVAVHEASPNVLLVLEGDGWDGPPLWRSENGGATFTAQWDAGLPLETYDEETHEGCFPSYTNIATTPADPNIAYVVQRGGDSVHCPPAIHRTFARLEASPAPGPADAPIQVFAHPSRPEVLFVQMLDIRPDSSLYRSMDGGASFQLVAGGLANNSRGTLYRTLDSGQSWGLVGVDTGPVFLRSRQSEIVVDPKDPNSLNECSGANPHAIRITGGARRLARPPCSL